MQNISIPPGLGVLKTDHQRFRRIRRAMVVQNGSYLYDMM